MLPHIAADDDTAIVSCPVDGTDDIVQFHRNTTVMLNVFVYALPLQ